MHQVWRWFGPADKVSLSDARQAGAKGIVSSLHHIPAGLLWSREEIAKRQQETAFHKDGRPTGLKWDVVESLPVSEAIKTQTGDWRGDIKRYQASLEHLARQGIFTVCYNFMPVLDWTRTELEAPMLHGGTAMRFDLADFAAFDIYILARPNAEGDYSPDVIEAADQRSRKMDEKAKARLSANITAGLPGAAEHWSLQGLREKLQDYAHINADALHRHHADFLSEIAPIAERLDMRMCCHPDDPPFPLLGLPRVASTAADYRALFKAIDSPHVGMTFCTGSLGARHDNDMAEIAREFAPKIHFAHLRNVTRAQDQIPCSFFEDEHLEGNTNMVMVLDALLGEEARRRAEGRVDWQIPMRPDHGQAILHDLKSGAQPGYPAVGRLKGLAELRGIIHALSQIRHQAR